MANSPDVIREATGKPGGPPRWTSGGKVAGGTSRSDVSVVWFTIGQGVLNEVYYARVDLPCTRDLHIMITGPDRFFSDERDDAEHTVQWLEDGVPGFRVTSTCKRGHYQVEKTFIADDRLNVVLQHVRVSELADDHRLFVKLNPHLGARGLGNTGWVGTYKGQVVLLAERCDLALALRCSVPYVDASAGYIEKSDGISDLKKYGRLCQTFTRAVDGNVALVGEVPVHRGGEFTLALGFGIGPSEAAYHAHAGLMGGFAIALQKYVERWQAWQDELIALDHVIAQPNLYRKSTAILMSHTNKSIPGAVASLAIPWGDARGDDDLLQGAYHLVWSRDLVQHGGGFLAMGAQRESVRVLEYLKSTQEPDGHWPQNMWVSGEAFWDGIQVDQSAQPILLADLAQREGALSDKERECYWPMIQQAVGYVVRNGASTELDRWEEQNGYNPYTLATMITALLAAADWADHQSEMELAGYLRDTADIWESSLEGWLYVRDTKLAQRLGIDGYYARILPPSSIKYPYAGQSSVQLIDANAGDQEIPAHEVASVDALALVRFGLRSADDPRILDTLKVIDANLKLETERGPVWHRYTADRFGEHDDGAPFDTQRKGRGRAWPLLIGERAHYELARGRREEAKGLAMAMANYAGEAGLISEQVWDADDIPHKRLFKGRPTGSAAPLLWAHSEYLKLLRSLRDKRVFDQPPQAVRYHAQTSGSKPPSVKRSLWRFEHPLESLPAGSSLRIEATDSAEITWRIGKGAEKRLSDARSFLGVHYVDIPASELTVGTHVDVVAQYTASDGSQQRQHHVVEVIQPD